MKRNLSGRARVTVPTISIMRRKMGAAQQKSPDARVSQAAHAGKSKVRGNGVFAAA